MPSEGTGLQHKGHSEISGGNASETRLLLEQAQAGNREAFARLFRRFAGQLSVYVTVKMGRKLRRHLEVDDVLQEIYLRLLGCLPTFDPRRSRNLYAWIRSVAENVLSELSRHYLGTLKRSGVPRRLDLQADSSAGRGRVAALCCRDPSPSRIAVSRERVLRIIAVLDGLPERERSIVWDSVFEGLSGREVAEKHAVSPATVSRCLARILMRLGREISND
jgi:RNA polymerase sigma-70 factor (ECF subfamily)